MSRDGSCQNSPENLTVKSTVSTTFSYWGSLPKTETMVTVKVNLEDNLQNLHHGRTSTGYIPTQPRKSKKQADTQGHCGNTFIKYFQNEQKVPQEIPGPKSKTTVLM